MAKRREACHPSLRSLYFNYSYYCLLCTTNTTNTWFCSFIHQYHRQLLAWVDQLVHEGHRWGSSTDDQVVAGEGRHVSAFPRFSFSAFFSATVSFWVPASSVVIPPPLQMWWRESCTDVNSTFTHCTNSSSQNNEHYEFNTSWSSVVTYSRSLLIHWY